MSALLRLALLLALAAGAVSAGGREAGAEEAGAGGPGAGDAAGAAAPGSGAGEAAARCQVAGYDVLLFNAGAEDIAAGRTLAWAVPVARAEGRHRLAAPLAPGRFVLLTGALGESYLRPTARCAVTVE